MGQELGTPQAQPSGRPVPSADGRSPALRCRPHRVCVLPASAADDRELPAVPSAQGLALWWPLHELHQGGESRPLRGCPLQQRAGGLRCGSQRSGFSYVLHTWAGHLSEPQFPQSQRRLRSPGGQRILSLSLSSLLSHWMQQGLWLPSTDKLTQSGPHLPVRCPWLSGLVR